MPSGDRSANRKAVEDELNLAEARILQLQYELYGIRQRLNETTPILYHLPADVMVEIFQDLLPAQATVEAPEYGCSEQPVQFTLGAVCRTWRSTAWSFPGLWKGIHLTFDEDRGDTQLGLIQEWVERTGNLPLDISLDLNTSEHDHVLDRILRVLLLECGRWHSLAVEGDASHQLRREMSEGDYTFPLLASIFLGPESDGGTIDGEYYFPWTFRTGSSLQNLALEEESKWTKDQLDLHWSSIKRFTFAGTETAGLEFLAAMAESILSAQILFTSIDGDYTDTRLPVLQKLSIGDKDNTERLLSDSVITVLDTPALQCLSLYLQYDAIDLSVLTNALARSKCTLVELTLLGLDVPVGDLIELLRGLPNLHRLEFELESALTDEFIDALNPPLADGQSTAHIPLLPHISEIKYSGPISFQPPNMVNMLRSRLQGQTLDASIEPLKKFTIHCLNPNWASSTNPNLLRTFYHEIWTLKSSGTAFDIDYESSDSEEEEDGEESDDEE